MSTRVKITTLSVGMGAFFLFIGAPLSGALCLGAAYFAFKKL
jgi:hypothetical protein